CEFSRTWSRPSVGSWWSSRRNPTSAGRSRPPAAPGPAAGSPGQARRSRLDDAGLQPGQLAVGRLAHDVDVLLRLVPDPEALHPGQVLPEGLPQALELLPVLGRHRPEEPLQAVLLDADALRHAGQLPQPAGGQLATVVPQERLEGGVL